MPDRRPARQGIAALGAAATAALREARTAMRGGRASPARPVPSAASLAAAPPASAAPASARSLQALLDLAPDAMLVVSPDGRIVQANAHAVSMFGYQRAELTGQPLETLVPERFRSAHHRHRAGFMTAPTARVMASTLEASGRRRDGTEFAIEVTLSPHVGGEGIVIVSAIRDVTERKRSEEARLQLAAAQSARVQAEAAAEQLRRLQFIVDASLTHTSLDDILHDLLTRITAVMKAQTATIFLAGGDDGRLTVRNTVGPASALATATAVQPGTSFAVRVASERRSLVLDKVTPDAPEAQCGPGARSLLGAPLLIEGRVTGVIQVGAATPQAFNEDDARLLQLVADRTALAIEHARLYEAEHAARSEAETANRVKDEFLSTAAHELKTPVATIKAYVQLLARRAAEGQSSLDQQALAVTNRQCDRLTRLVQDLLEVSRLALGRIELRAQRTALEALVAEVVERTRALAPAHQILFEAEHNLFTDIDPDRIEQVLSNLLSNAIKFSEPGTEISIRVTRDGAEAVVEVEDRGIGIAAERQPRVFERFYRAHDAGAPHYDGMGLGLHLSREMVTRHGGRMWFNSVEGQGSTFSFSLPLAQA